LAWSYIAQHIPYHSNNPPKLAEAGGPRICPFIFAEYWGLAGTPAHRTKKAAEDSFVGQVLFKTDPSPEAWQCPDHDPDPDPMSYHVCRGTYVRVVCARPPSGVCRLCAPSRMCLSPACFSAHQYFIVIYFAFTQESGPIRNPLICHPFATNLCVVRALSHFSFLMEHNRIVVYCAKY